MRARKRGGLLRLLLKKAQAVQTDTDTLALCILVRGNLALGGAVPWLHSAGDARLPRCTGLVAHRHYWAHNDATGISPAQTKFSETSNAARSCQGVPTSLRDEFGSHWIKQRANNWKIHPAASQLLSPHARNRTGFYSARS